MLDNTSDFLVGLRHTFHTSPHAGAERIVIADPSAKEWLSRVKCLAVRPYDPRTSSSLGKAMALLTSPRFIKRSVKGGMLTWCREDVGAL